MSRFVRIGGLAAAASVLWCATIAAHSFEPQAGAGLPRLAGGPELQLLIALAALVSAGLIAAATFALARPSGRFGQPLWLVVCLLGWAALGTTIAAHAAELFLAPEDYELGVGAGVPSSAAPAWGAWSWTVALACGGLAVALLVRWALQERRPEGVSRRPA